MAVRPVVAAAARREVHSELVVEEAMLLEG
jgi:hypothetical protein